MRWFSVLVTVFMLMACGKSDGEKASPGSSPKGFNLNGVWSNDCKKMGDNYWMFSVHFNTKRKTFKEIWSLRYANKSCSRLQPGEDEVEFLSHYRVGKKISDLPEFFTSGSTYEFDARAEEDEEWVYMAIHIDDEKISFSIPQNDEGSLIKGEDGESPETRAKSVFGRTYFRQ